MKRRNLTPLLASLAADYERHSPRSAAINREALKHLIDGGSHTIRLLQPFPPRITAANGAYVTDEDGHRILDFWQGHYANILGHNPPVIADALSHAFASGMGLQTGFTDSLQVRTAELLCSRTGAERVRFTSSGALATMYAILLSLGFTGREMVLKVGGGWHGAHPWGLFGVDFHAENAQGREQQDSMGLPPGMADQVVVTRFNDLAMLESMFAQHGRRIACFILEPFLGSGGCLPASREYLHAARRLTQKHGALLIFDEVISGFRFCAGSITRLFDVQPDLATYAKIIGGGMPVAAVAGRAEVMKLAGRGGGVKFSGGTYSAHPASLLASHTMMQYLAAHENVVYPRLSALAEKARQAIEAACAAEGITARCSGRDSNAIPLSSMGAVHFPYDPATPCDSPDKTRNPDLFDVELADSVLQLSLLLQDVFVMHGFGAVSTAHTENDIGRLQQAYRKSARRIAPFF